VKKYLLGMFAVAALLLAPSAVSAQLDDGGCGDCEECTGMDTYRVNKKAGGGDYISTGGDCPYRSGGCEAMWECPNGTEEDAEAEERVSLNDALAFTEYLEEADWVSLNQLVARLGNNVQIDAEQGTALLFGGCTGDRVLVSAPISREVTRNLIDAGAAEFED